MTRGGGSGIVEGVRSRSGIAMANRCADDGGTALVVGEAASTRLFLSFFLFIPFFSFFIRFRGGSDEVKRYCQWIRTEKA